MVRVVATDADRNRTISYSIEGFRNITKLVGIDKARYLVPGCFYADKLTFEIPSTTVDQRKLFPPAVRLLLLEKWIESFFLGSTSPSGCSYFLCILYLCCCCLTIIMILSIFCVSNFNWKIGPKFSHLLTVRAEGADPTPPLLYSQPGRFFYDSPKIFFHQGG